MAGDRVFERAFNRAAAASIHEEAERPIHPIKESITPGAEAAATIAATPMQVSDAIQRVLLADKDKDYFRYIPQVCERLRPCAAVEPHYCWNSIDCTSGCHHLNPWLLCCRLMELPQPEADELGRPVLQVTSADISKAYRRISVLVHPDKNPGEDARKAFEALNAAHRKLRDPGQLVSSTASYTVACCSSAL